MTLSARQLADGFAEAYKAAHPEPEPHRLTSSATFPSNDALSFRVG
jgi:hypothetical protein